MMKWGRKKNNTQTPSTSSHSSSSPQSFFSHAFPMSWLSRFKNVTRKTSSVSPKSGVASDSWNGGRFYGRDDDSYWSLSFRKDRLKGDQVGRSCGLKSEQNNSDNDQLHSPLQVVTPRRKAKERNYGYSGKVGVRARRRRGLKRRKPGEERRRVWKDGKEFQRKSDKDSQKHSRRQNSISYSNSIDLGTIEEDCIFEGSLSEQNDASSEDELSNNWLNQKNMIPKNESHQKITIHLQKERRRRRRRRMKQNQKLEACSPRSPAKIKAFEDMKRARMKTIKEEVDHKDKTNFESFAVMKCSLDPEEDFRESMVEMIREKRIREAEALEELLACYLTLNCDEYHDLIVKVFREVWLDLNQEQFDQELELINCYL